ncbi:LytTR family DNA-binding domain-containing protein [Algibacter sp. L4_22]|uniref:LytR/AlgR family response regulator transcription factor n=1 Tax=Algibacter sp. L4_22 TaxID=2942477 RepID=UPI00201B7CD5|nr:response regulator [Algibacter sp. L4_22]MCL5129345.1 response regulator [Algibacter sp. L4_22]
MIRYILVDDNTNTLARVKNKIDKLPKEYELKHIQSYDSSKKAYEDINKDDYDLLIVDFEMPMYNGIELAQEIATNKKIIFLTSTTKNEKKVINSLDISGFLNKPFDINEFENILKRKIIGKINPSPKQLKNDLITLEIGANKDIRFKPERVFYISSSVNKTSDKLPLKNCVHIYGENDEILYKDVRLSIKDLEKKLDDYNFKKISQSTIINLSHLKVRDNTNISLYNVQRTFEVKATEKTGLINKLRAIFN